MNLHGWTFKQYSVNFPNIILMCSPVSEPCQKCFFWLPVVFDAGSSGGLMRLLSFDEMFILFLILQIIIS